MARICSISLEHLIRHCYLYCVKISHILITVCYALGALEELVRLAGIYLVQGTILGDGDRANRDPRPSELAFE